MKNKKIFLISLISLVIVLSLVTVVSAQSVFDNFFKAIAGERFDMAELYDKYGPFIDLVVYLILFIGISQATIGKRFEGKGGKAVIIAIGIALSVSLAFWGAKNNFNLGSFGWLAGAVFMVVLFYAIYYLLKELMGAKEFSQQALPVFIGVIIVWYAAQAVSPKLMEKIIAIPVVGPLMPAVISLCLFGVLILGGMKLFGMFKAAPSESLAAAPIVERQLGRKEEKIAKQLEEDAEHALDLTKGTEDLTDVAKEDPRKINDISNNLSKIKGYLDREVQNLKMLANINNQIKNWQTMMISQAGEEKTKLEKEKKDVEAKSGPSAGLIFNRRLQNIEKRIESIKKQAEGAYVETRKIDSIKAEVFNQLDIAGKEVNAIQYLINLKDIDKAKNSLKALNVTINNIKRQTTKIDKIVSDIRALVQLQRITTRKESKEKRQLEKKTKK